MQKTLTTRCHRHMIALLIQAREKKGLTQAELAKKLVEYQSFVARLESGQRRLDVVEFLRVAEALHIDAARLLKQLAQIRD